MSIRIPGPGAPGNVNAPKARPAPRDTDAPRPESATEPVDKVAVAGEEVAAARKIIDETPDVDEAKIAALRAAIRNGTYRLDLGSVAERIIAEAALLGR